MEASLEKTQLKFVLGLEDQVNIATFNSILVWKYSLYGDTYISGYSEDIQQDWTRFML